MEGDAVGGEKSKKANLNKSENQFLNPLLHHDTTRKQSHFGVAQAG